MSIYLRITSALKESRKYYDKLTINQLLALLAVASEEGLNQVKVSQAVGIDQQQIANVIRTLELNQLIKRIKSPYGGNENNIYLSDKGIDLMTEIERIFL